MAEDEEAELGTDLGFRSVIRSFLEGEEVEEGSITKEGIHEQIGSS